MSDKPLTKDEIAEMIARDIPYGSYVNLGIGLPTLVSNHISPDADVILHTENGMLGMGAEAEGDQIDPELINAGKIAILENLGASYFHHADSFAMIRGGHIDLCVLGAFQVSFNGDLANWHAGNPDDIPSVGGAMDLASGAAKTYIFMTLFDKAGNSKLVPQCTIPLTAKRCVDRIYTDLATLAITDSGIEIIDVYGITESELKQRVGFN